MEAFELLDGSFSVQEANEIKDEVFKLHDKIKKVFSNKKFEKMKDNHTVTVGKMKHYTTECADVIITEFSKLYAMGQSSLLADSIIEKIEVNRDRPERHGKNF
jgi:hypothetical protein